MLGMTRRIFTCTCGQETDSVPRPVSDSEPGNSECSCPVASELVESDCASVIDVSAMQDCPEIGVAMR